MNTFPFVILLVLCTSSFAENIALKNDSISPLNTNIETLKEIPTDQGSQLQQRMEWFTQLPDDEKQKMRDIWQKMSTQERNNLRKRMQNASLEERVTIRDEYLSKYSEH